MASALLPCPARRPRGPGLRRTLLRSGLLCLVAPGLLAFGRCEERQKAHCAETLNAGFVAIAAAQRARIEHCARRDAQEGRAHQSFSGCLAGDGLDAVAWVRWIEGRRAAQACRAGAPPGLSYASPDEAAGAAVAAGNALARGLFGPDPDLAILSRSAGHASVCQQELLRKAGDCAGAFLEGFQRCARERLRHADVAPADLVACKDAGPEGAVARACDQRIEAVVADACAAQDPGHLFPGCAGDPAACARAHARRSASLGLNQLTGLCADLLPGDDVPEETLLRCFEPPAMEPIASELVALPDGVRVLASNSLVALRSGDEVQFGAAVSGFEGEQVVRMGLDGSALRCLTCGIGIPAGQSVKELFRDGRRALVSGGNALLARPSWSILECTPSLEDCGSAALLPIELPPAPAEQGNQVLNYRVPQVTPDDGWLIWTEVRQRGPGNFLSAMGRLVREGDRYFVRDARILAPSLGSLDLGNDALLWQRLSANYEAKSGWLRGGRDWVLSGTWMAGHYDDFAIDLATGDLRRLTRHPDHDEGLHPSPDAEWMVLGSGRGNGRVDFLGLLPRPPFIDGIAFSIHFVGIAGAPSDGPPGSSPLERDCYLEPWLTDRWFERGDYLGQELAAPGADGWEPVPGLGWSPDGTRMILMEGVWDRLLAPGQERPLRLRLLRFPNRLPVPPSSVEPIVATPEPAWAIRYEDYVLPDLRGVHTIPGRHSGTATLTIEGNAFRGAQRVEYDGYSDDGLRFLDGHEEIRIPLLVQAGAEYDVDLHLGGFDQGRMVGSISYDFLTDANAGNVVSELNGRRLEGPRTCEEAGILPAL